MYLTLPLPPVNRSGQKRGALYIEECLNKFVEEEILDGNDAWHCPRCKVPRRSSKRLTIVKLPMVLLVHLKRFSFSGPFRDKVETYVEFPIRSFDITDYVPSNISGNARQQSYVYDLYAVSVI